MSFTHTLSSMNGKENIFYPLKSLDLPVDFDLKKISQKIQKEKIKRKDSKS